MRGQLLDYTLDYYDVLNINRNNKRGGGVMIYVSKSLKYTKVQNMCEEVNDMYECIPIEIETIKGSNIIVTCIYRSQGSNIDDFTEHSETLFKKVKRNKALYLVRDLNINLINYDQHCGTRNFIDTINSYGIMPLINKPTRISIDSCTLIDNIFSNDLKIFKSGILINDLSDHLPIFTILSEDRYFKQRTNKYSYKRQNVKLNLNNFKTGIETV